MVLAVSTVVVAGWTWWQLRPGGLAQGSAAYASGDYQQAADRAKQRLKVSPQDSEALRLLARSTARLGRDAPANALFARLGEKALQAEDLFLLGVGLDRAGRKDAAEKVWLDGLALEPDHPELIERLIVQDTARNRLAHAATLADRLARRPGWEFWGELDQGMIRSELGDPAGAASALQRALDRPEAARLDRPTLSHHRKLLARSLLRTARPAEAAAVLRQVLGDGPDPEASWLLSRAALQRDSIAEAVAALKAAGSYRAEHPLESEPSPFVGEGRCRACHADKVELVQASRHSTTLVRGKPLAELPYPASAVPDPDDGAVTHVFRHDGDRVRLETRVRDRVLHAVVDYAFGSPDHYASLVGHDDRGDPYIFRLSYFQSGPDSGWVRTTGHTADAAGGHNFLGKPISPLDGVHTCLFCHATDPRSVLDRSGPAASDRAIGCERCHGPGENHLRAVAAGSRDLAIVNPASAPAEGRLRVCGQCHSNHAETTLPRTDPFWIRFQSSTLPWSRCYTESRAMDCTTCHDPHHDKDRSEKHHDARCLDCHSGRSRPENPAVPRTDDRPAAHPRPSSGSACPVNPVDGCVRCHMPTFHSEPLHADFTDHFIRVHPDTRPGARSSPP
jgi:Flp pilus assembly protein TadD